MITWIEEHKEELWRWINHCYDESAGGYDCKKCPIKEACDAIWEIVMKIT